jgi:hypothetical protein
MRFPPTSRICALCLGLAFALTALAGEVRILVQSSPLAGFQYHAGEALWQEMREGDRLALVREADNPHDGNAVRVEWRGQKLGYLPRAENRSRRGGAGSRRAGGRPHREIAPAPEPLAAGADRSICCTLGLLFRPRRRGPAPLSSNRSILNRRSNHPLHVNRSSSHPATIHRQRPGQARSALAAMAAPIEAAARAWSTAWRPAAR